MKIINRDLSTDKDGIPGYIAHPDRKEPGPGVLIVHHHFGVTGHMKSTVCNFAKLGYTTIVPDLYKLLGISDGVHEAQKRSEEHTSELQSPDHLVCRLLLEKKKH